MEPKSISAAPTPRWERLAIGSGIIAISIYLLSLAIFIVFIVPNMPAIDAPAEAFAASMTAQSENMMYRLYAFLAALRMPFLLLFFGGLFAVLRKAEGEGGALSAAVFASGITIAIILPLVAIVEDHLMLGFAASGIDPRIVKAVDGLVPLTIALLGFPQALALGGTAALCSTRKVASAWMVGAGYLLAMISLLGTGTLIIGPGLFPIAMLASLLFNLWFLTLCVSLLRSLPSLHLQAAVQPAQSGPIA